MANMKLNDFRHLFDKIQNGKILIGIYVNKEGNEDLLFSFFRSYKDNRVYHYHNIFSSYSVDDEPADKWMNDEWSIDLSEVKTHIVNYDMFLSWKRQSIINNFKYHYLHPEEKCNFFTIKDKVAKDGGKIVTFSDYKKEDECGLLIGVVSTDEDYYYKYVDGNLKIQNMTCVGGYKVMNMDDIPQSLNKFKRGVSKRCTRLILNNLKNGMLREAEVFFTPIYLDKMSKDDLTFFKQFSLLYLPENSIFASENIK